MSNLIKKARELSLKFNLSTTTEQFTSTKEFIRLLETITFNGRTVSRLFHVPLKNDSLDGVIEAIEIARAKAVLEFFGESDEEKCQESKPEESRKEEAKQVSKPVGKAKTNGTPVNGESKEIVGEAKPTDSGKGGVPTGGVIPEGMAIPEVIEPPKLPLVDPKEPQLIRATAGVPRKNPPEKTKVVKLTKYNRLLAPHKNEFIKLLDGIHPNWANEPEYLQKASKASHALNEVDFMDEKGAIISSFLDELTSLMA